MPKPKLVIFDCDGVLVDSETLTSQIIRDDLAARGLILTLEQTMDRFVGGTMGEVAEKASGMGADVPTDWVKQIYQKIYAGLATSVELIPGVVELLDRLDANDIAYAVGSNGSIEKMQITLGRTGLLARMQGRMFSAQDCENAKPAPDVYLKAASAMRMDPKSCAIIEDSASGAKAGHAAGIRTFGFTRETPPQKLQPYCQALFENMLDLPELLELEH